MMIVVITATNLLSANRIMNARTMNRIELVYRVARFGFLLALGVLALSALFATGAPVKDDLSNRNEVTTDTTLVAECERSDLLGAVSPIAIILEILLIAPDISDHSSTKLIEKFSRYNTIIS